MSVTSALTTIANLLAHEANEMTARSNSPEIYPGHRTLFEHQKRGLLHALEIVEAIQSGQRPGGGIRSRGANHFHRYGELLPVGSAECFPAAAPEVRLEGGARTKFYAVHQLEADELGVVHLRGIAPAAVVGNCDDDLHE